jgi:hypothetical protein
MNSNKEKTFKDLSKSFLPKPTENSQEIKKIKRVAAKYKAKSIYITNVSIEDKNLKTVVSKAERENTEVE